MPAVPTHLVLRADGREAGALFDLPHQGKVCLQIVDEGLARLLTERGITPPRPPFLDAAGHGVHGGYATRPQRNWFLVPPLESAVGALEAVLASTGYALVPAPAPAHT